MKKELQQILFDNFPDFFSYADRQKNPPPWWPISRGISVNDGWFEIIRELCCRISSVENLHNFKFKQIKQKLGYLAIYTEGSYFEINKLICYAESEASETCEFCGTKKYVKRRKPFGWIYVICLKCYVKYVIERTLKDFINDIKYNYKRIIRKFKK